MGKCGGAAVVVVVVSFWRWGSGGGTFFCGWLGIGDRTVGRLRSSVTAAKFERAAEAVRIGAGFDDVGAVGDAIEQRLAKPRVRNDLRPFGERQIRRQQH